MRRTPRLQDLGVDAPVCEICGSDYLVGYVGQLRVCGHCFHDTRRRPAGRDYSRFMWLAIGAAIGYAVAVAIVLWTQAA